MKFYLVEIVNELTLSRSYCQVDASSAREAADFVEEKLSDDDIIANVFVESDEAWS